MGDILERGSNSRKRRSSDILIPDASLRNDERVLRVLRFYEQPLPVSTVALLLNMDKGQCKRTFDSLKKFGRIKLATRCTMGFYRPTASEQGSSEASG